ncbi:ABC transporter permease [Bacteroides sp. 214]|uniref:ABC transporter permease n=1 Tax=Bacteroides sp. 214 TaxID=2302935 RepID=UPI0013D2396F|nr:FtsX-like permease family protein [Bacteroides sp. 214]NDW11337.1 ABC transporter permease [Bacteroides sp. 214]
MYRANDGEKEVSRPATLIATAGIAIGLAVMIIAVAVVIGFKKEVKDKIVGFGSDIQIANLDAVRSYETLPVAVDEDFMTTLLAKPEITHVQRYSTKPGIIKTDDAFQGMVLKGLGAEFDPSFFTKHLQEGVLPAFSDTVASNQVLISRSFATKLKLKLDDRIYTYYFQDNNVRARRLTVCGIYETNFSEYDNLFLLSDIYTVNRLNGWKGDQVSGLELRVANYNQLEDITYALGDELSGRSDEFGELYFVRNIEQLNPNIFGWLAVLDFNIWIILILMIGVAGFTMISGLLIIIIERTNMIGTLKALGANNYTIRKIFLWFAVFLIGKGMLIGNAIGLLFYVVQSQFGLFKLDPANYYMDTVPVYLNVWVFLLLNIGTLLVSVLMLLAPSYLITRINPAASMRYE